MAGPYPPVEQDRQQEEAVPCGSCGCQVAGRRTECAVCGGSTVSVLSLPNFPLTGVFVASGCDDGYDPIDQELVRCVRCGHCQLLNTVDPVYLYQDTYTHRSGRSPMATRGNDFFLSFLNEVASGRRFECVVEIGCNDLYLLKRMEASASRLYGFDPIWKDGPPPNTGKIVVCGKFAENIIPAADIPERPDLILSVHTLEHIDAPLASLEPLVAHAREDALIVVEVPCLDSLIHACRFDQVFHQHVNYFSVASLKTMFTRLGAEYVSHRFDHGYWQGTLLMAFRKSGAAARRGGHASGAPPKAAIERQLGLFRRQMAATRRIIDHLLACQVTVFGYGAAQMVPTLAYHLGTDFGFLRAILDDKQEKHGLTYPGLHVAIEATRDLPSLADAAVMVTAIDSTRPILRRLTDLRARYILNPFHLL